MHIMNNLLGDALVNFKKGGALVEIMKLLRMVANNAFPLNNITFQLVMEVINVYSVGCSTTKMSYKEETTKWWRAG
jgi:hypothetical protein